MAILAILAGILFPVFVKAKYESRVAAAKLNLKGFWQGIILYQSENDAKVDYGLAEDMGLPSPHDGWNSFLNKYTGDSHLGWSTKQSFLPCGMIQGGDLTGMGLIYLPSHYSWERQVLTLQESAVLLSDPTCNRGLTSATSPKVSKRAIGITLGGQLRDRSRVDLAMYDQRFYR